MRINKFIAQHTGLSRRAADEAVADGRVLVNNVLGVAGQELNDSDKVKLDNKELSTKTKLQTIALNKPIGYVVSRQGQGSRTIYDLLPRDLEHLKPIGRLDKESSGLILLTNDGQLAQELTHPKFAKTKIYEIKLDKPLQPLHWQMIQDHGVQLDDGPSKLILERLKETDDQNWRVYMQEGRNRQIRRTFSSLGYEVKKLHRTVFGPYTLDELPTGSHKEVIQALADQQYPPDN